LLSKLVQKITYLVSNELLLWYETVIS